MAGQGQRRRRRFDFALSFSAVSSSRHQQHQSNLKPVNLAEDMGGGLVVFWPGCERRMWCWFGGEMRALDFLSTGWK